MVYRIYVEKKQSLAHEAAALKADLTGLLGMGGLEQVRIVNRCDVEGISEELFRASIPTVFSEPQLDIASGELSGTDGCAVFAVEYLPGQFDQRADSAAQCIQIISQGERPSVRTAKVYILRGALTPDDVAAVKKYVINPVESREASLEPVQTLATDYEKPTTVATMDGFRELDTDGLNEFLNEYGLAMDLGDVQFCQDYFRKEGRDPTITEIRMIDTYWSDHCRHTTFSTTIDRISFADPVLERAYARYVASRKQLGRTKPVNLMDIGTLAAKILKSEGRLDGLDESEEINACTVKIKVDTENGPEDWLLLFKNETHNHPTEIEPFGGAATCIGGAIRDPLSGRSYVYAAMRVTGAADPLTPVEDTLPGKLPQRKIVTTAAAGYSSYGNQIGLATGLVSEVYHPGYAAKRMEVGAVIAAAPAENVRRETPAPGDVVILLGGRTGRDGCGGATGSSKSHTLESLEHCGAEVQKGNAPEERKLQRLFRDPEASRRIKRCNDFGAGGVSVAVGELADSLDISLDAVPKKYEGLDGTELAISESQERMAVVVAPEDVDAFCRLADRENIEATVVATVTDTGRLVMHWNGNTIVDISREFLNSNGAEKHIDIETAAPQDFSRPGPADFGAGMEALAGDLNACSQRGLSERFDSTIGAGSVLMPFGGKYQRTPIQAMVHKISRETGDTDTVSFMSWGFNPYISEKSPYHGAYLAVVESAAKLVAAGAEFSDVYLSFQEYFAKPGHEPARWGQPLSALLGAFEAQLDLGIAAIGGKDSMSGTFEHLDVPPTLISFAVTTGKLAGVVSPEFKAAEHKLIWLRPELTEEGLPEPKSQLAVFARATELMRAGKVAAAYTPGYGGAAEAVLKMTLGNRIGFRFEDGVALSNLFSYAYGSLLLEVTEDVPDAFVVGETIHSDVLIFEGKSVELAPLRERYEGKLESVYPCNIAQTPREIESPRFEANAWPKAKAHFARPKVLIPVFPGTNCEYDSAKAITRAGAEPEIVVLRNLTSDGVRESVATFAEKVRSAQMIFIPGGFSGGDEPDGSGKFITAFFRNGAIRDAVNDLLTCRDGLMAGICNGFQALIKLGLVPYGEIREPDENAPTLTFNTIGRHQSKIVRTRVVSNKSPWLMKTQPDEVYTVPISHGEGRFLASEEIIRALAANGQIATQYVDLDGKPAYDVVNNPNDSAWAIEGITSPDGRVLGKMGHSERVGTGLYQNVPGRYEMGLFESAVEYFR